MSLRLGSRALLAFAIAVHLHIHNRFHGPPVDYATLAVASAASWIGLPGPGEPVLIAAGILAAHHRLDIVSVVVVAFASAVGGSIVGWLAGLKLGRAVLEFPGPLLNVRRRILARGDEVFSRYEVVAIILAPAPLAGIHHVRPWVYIATTLIWGALWSCGIGVGAYFVGPPVIDAVGDLGWVTGGGLVALVLAGGLAEWRRRRRQADPGDMATP